ncbi:MAG: rhodanese-like domain-containing protein [Sphingobacteriaceae bacterium]|nr:MAG: rhodanese-like domain-containing protein [Sphingobacteriaceae bacterium]
MNKPLILNIGVVTDIKGARHIGAVSEAQNMKKLNTAVHLLPKTTPVVIYCGCCPFNKCPNIRPAFTALQKEGFTNIKVLDLPTNLKVDWSSKGYPLAETK